MYLPDCNKSKSIYLSIYLYENLSQEDEVTKQLSIIKESSLVRFVINPKLSLSLSSPKLQDEASFQCIVQVNHLYLYLIPQIKMKIYVLKLCLNSYYIHIVFVWQFERDVLDQLDWSLFYQIGRETRAAQSSWGAGCKEGCGWGDGGKFIHGKRISIIDLFPIFCILPGHHSPACWKLGLYLVGNINGFLFSNQIYIYII